MRSVSPHIIRLWAACFLCASCIMSAPHAYAQSAALCTLHAPLEVFSEPKGQGLRIRLETGNIITVLSQTGTWFGVYTGNSTAYVAALAFARACWTPFRPGTMHSKSTDLIEIPLEPLPPAPPSLPRDDAASASPSVSPSTQAVTAPLSGLELPAPVHGRQDSRHAFWADAETGLWIGGGLSLTAAVVLYTVNSVRYAGVKERLDQYNVDANNFLHGTSSLTQADLNQMRTDRLSEKNLDETIDLCTWVTGALGVTALGSALSLHYFGPHATGHAEPTSLSTLRIHVGWGRVAIAGELW